MEKIANLSVAEAKALRLLERKRGVDVPTLCDRLEMEERQARSVIDRLRRKGVPVQRLAKGKFQCEHVVADVRKPAARMKQPSNDAAPVWDGVERRRRQEERRQSA